MSQPIGGEESGREKPPASLKVPSTWGPVGEGERIETLDVLRGFAVFGILLANVFIFALPSTHAGSAGQGRAVDQAVALLVALFVEGKFYSLFSLLFGMGLMLQCLRAERDGRPFVALYVRRLAALFLIGLLHALLLYSADILAFYAVIGLAALAFRNLKPRALLASAAAVCAIGLAVLCAYGFRNPSAPLASEPDWARLAEGDKPALKPTGEGGGTHRVSAPAMPAALVPIFEGVPAMLGVSEADFYKFMADQERIFRSGSCGEMVRHRAVTFLLVNMPLRLFFTSWQILWLFLLGMYFTRRSVFIDVGRNPDPCRKMLFLGFPAGMFLQFVGGVAQLGLARSVLLLPVFLACIYFGTLIVGLSYAGALALLYARKGFSVGFRALAAVGRTALTNYVGQSVVCDLIFTGCGLGLFGRLGRAEAILLTLPVFAGQLILSSLWLRFFQFGPLEWVWRTLTYMKLQPMRRDGGGGRP